MLWRHTQVVKGEVCKTSIPRFESGWRLHFVPGLMKTILSPGLLLFALGCTQTPTMSEVYLKHLERSRPEAEPPLDYPRWSQTRYVHWMPLASQGDRVIVIDIPGGRIDSLLDPVTVARRLNLDFRSLFLHPRARPSLTRRLDWPSVTVLDGQGCLLATGSPTTSEEVIALLERATQARDGNAARPLPQPTVEPADAPGGGIWTLDDPAAAAIFVSPDRGAPAVVVDNRPYVFGNRADAEALGKRPAARSFLDSLNDEEDYSASEGPLLNCALDTKKP